MGRPYTGHRLATRSAIGRNTQAGPPLNLTLPNTYLFQPETEEERINRNLQQMLQGSRQPSQVAQEEGIVTRIIEVFNNFPRDVTLQNENGMFQLTMGGLTAELREGEDRAGIHMSFGGEPEVYVDSSNGPNLVRVSSSPSQPMRFQFSHRDIHFTGTLTPDHWQVALSIGSLVPDINELPHIFRQGERGMRGALLAIDGLERVSPSTVQQAVEPHIQPIKDSIHAASQIAHVRHRVNFSLHARGPTPNSRGSQEEGFQVGVLLTITF